MSEPQTQLDATTNDPWREQRGNSAKTRTGARHLKAVARRRLWLFGGMRRCRLPLLRALRRPDVLSDKAVAP